MANQWCEGEERPFSSSGHFPHMQKETEAPEDWIVASLWSNRLTKFKISMDKARCYENFKTFLGGTLEELKTHSKYWTNMFPEWSEDGTVPDCAYVVTKANCSDRAFPSTFKVQVEPMTFRLSGKVANKSDRSPLILRAGGDLRMHLAKIMGMRNIIIVHGAQIMTEEDGTGNPVRYLDLNERNTRRRAFTLALLRINIDGLPGWHGSSFLLELVQRFPESTNLRYEYTASKLNLKYESTDWNTTTRFSATHPIRKQTDALIAFKEFLQEVERLETEEWDKFSSLPAMERLKSSSTTFSSSTSFFTTKSCTMRKNPVLANVTEEEESDSENEQKERFEEKPSCSKASARDNATSYYNEDYGRDGKYETDVPFRAQADESHNFEPLSYKDNVSPFLKRNLKIIRSEEVTKSKKQSSCSRDAKQESHNLPRNYKRPWPDALSTTHVGLKRFTKSKIAVVIIFLLFAIWFAFHRFIGSSNFGKLSPYVSNIVSFMDEMKLGLGTASSSFSFKEFKEALYKVYSCIMSKN